MPRGQCRPPPYGYLGEARRAGRGERGYTGTAGPTAAGVLGVTTTCYSTTYVLTNGSGLWCSRVGRVGASVGGGAGTYWDVRGICADAVRCCALRAGVTRVIVVVVE